MKLMEQKHAQEMAFLSKWLDEDLEPDKVEELSGASRAERQRLLRRLRKKLKSLAPEKQKERHEALREGTLVTKVLKSEEGDPKEVPALIFADLQALQNKECEKLIRRADIWVSSDQAGLLYAT